mgnify:CR=1 FL=1
MLGAHFRNKSDMSILSLNRKQTFAKTNTAKQVLVEKQIKWRSKQFQKKCSKVIQSQQKQNQKFFLLISDTGLQLSPVVSMAERRHVSFSHVLPVAIFVTFSARTGQLLQPTTTTTAFSFSFFQPRCRCQIQLANGCDRSADRHTHRKKVTKRKWTGGYVTRQAVSVKTSRQKFFTVFWLPPTAQYEKSLKFRQFERQQKLSGALHYPEKWC